MLVPDSVEKRWGVEKNEKLILVPTKSHRIVELVRCVALACFCVLSAGLYLYFNPTIIDELYYGFWHHRTVIKIQKDPFGLNSLMNFTRFKKALESTGWTEKTDSLKQLVSKKRAKKIYSIWWTWSRSWRNGRLLSWKKTLPTG